VTDNVLRPDELEVAPGFAHEQLQGSVPAFATEEEIRLALEQAFDYRGDVTITRKDGAVVEGYLYDRRSATTLQASLIRILPADGTPRQGVPYSEIAALEFSGRDTAAGRSWEAWVRKYWEKRSAGEQAGLEPESLD
jgi:hypothetical protein